MSALMQPKGWADDRIRQTIIERGRARVRCPSRRNPIDRWADPNGVVIEFDSLHLDSCCPHESWWFLTDGTSGPWRFRVEGPLEFRPQLEAFNWSHPATSGMIEAWTRFCGHRTTVGMGCREPVGAP